MKDSRHMTEDWLKEQIESELFCEYGKHILVRVRREEVDGLYDAYIPGVCRAGIVRAVERASGDCEIEIIWDDENKRFEYRFEFDDAILDELKIPF